MAATLVNDLTGLFRTQALGQASAQLGESENSVMRGFQTATAAILGGLASRGNQPGFIRQIFDLISSPSNDRGVLSNIGSFFTERSPQGEGLGSRLLSMLFGGQQSRVAAGISEASGLKASSATTMMGIAAPIVMGALGKRVQEDHLDPSGLSNLLQSETSEVRNVLPSNLMSSVQNASSAVTEMGGRARDAAAGAASTLGSRAEDAYRTTMRPGTSAARWLWPLALGVLALILLLWFLGRGREQTARVTQQGADAVRSAAGNASDAARSAATSVGNALNIRLPNGANLSIPQNGMESKVVAFIQDSSKPVDNTTWFEFDRLSFEPGSATLRPESQEELNNLSTVLKAYPNVHAKIGGYTDNTGDANANMRLSQQRADSVRNQLVSMGVAADHLQAQGYGDQHPVADNSTPEGRARNRRIALLITQK